MRIIPSFNTLWSIIPRGMFLWFPWIPDDSISFVHSFDLQAICSNKYMFEISRHHKRHGRFSQSLWWVLEIANKSNEWVVAINGRATGVADKNCHEWQWNCCAKNTINLDISWAKRRHLEQPVDQTTTNHHSSSPSYLGNTMQTIQLLWKLVVLR